jgi:hypothetical protein
MAEVRIEAPRESVPRMRDSVAEPSNKTITVGEKCPKNTSTPNIMRLTFLAVADRSRVLCPKEGR